MARRAASITQADIARAVRAAKQAGATEVEVRVGDERIIIRINPSSKDESSVEQSHKIVL
jgi:DNA-binding XRE family transcriptional regulator